MTITATATGLVHATPDAVFTTLTDVSRLPEWNARMTHVVEQPAAMTPGAQWVVEFRVFGRTWHSRSTLEKLDPASHMFVYRSGTDDGNPSYAQWEWTVTPDPAGSKVSVRWELHPVTFWRRNLLVHMRARQLAHTELPASLANLARLASESPRSENMPS